MLRYSRRSSDETVASDPADARGTFRRRSPTVGSSATRPRSASHPPTTTVPPSTRDTSDPDRGPASGRRVDRCRERLRRSARRPSRSVCRDSESQRAPPGTVASPGSRGPHDTSSRRRASGRRVVTSTTTRGASQRRAARPSGHLPAEGSPRRSRAGRCGARCCFPRLRYAAAQRITLVDYERHEARRASTCPPRFARRSVRRREFCRSSRWRAYAEHAEPGTMRHRGVRTAAPGHRASALGDASSRELRGIAHSMRTTALTPGGRRFPQPTSPTSPPPRSSRAFPSTGRVDPRLCSLGSTRWAVALAIPARSCGRRTRRSCTADLALERVAGAR